MEIQIEATQKELEIFPEGTGNNNSKVSPTLHTHNNHSDSLDKITKIGKIGVIQPANRKAEQDKVQSSQTKNRLAFNRNRKRKRSHLNRPKPVDVRTTTAQLRTTTAQAVYGLNTYHHRPKPVDPIPPTLPIPAQPFLSDSLQNPRDLTQYLLGYTQRRHCPLPDNPLSTYYQTLAEEHLTLALGYLEKSAQV